MKTLIVTSEDTKDFTFLQELIKKLGYSAHVLYDEDIEDAAFLKAMVKEKEADYVSETEIMANLRKDES